MSKVVPGRFSAEIDQSFVVFIIGMRVNNIWAVNKWLPTAQAMGPMLNVLYRHPEKGFLGQESFFRILPQYRFDYLLEILRAFGTFCS
jgi:Domain of unknown function (DUF4188)